MDSKYRNKRTIVENQTFDSKREAEHFRNLLVMRFAKEPHQRVVKIECQPAFDIIINGVKCFTYRADFRVTYADGRMEVVDVKGFRTPLYRLKKKCVEAQHGIKIVEI